MTRSSINSVSTKDLLARLKSARAGEGIYIEAGFQRGSVWTNGEKTRYIDALMSGRPTSILTFVQGVEDERYAVLDGGNRLRTIRDFRANELKGKKFEDCALGEQAEFDAKIIPCEWVIIDRDDPPNIITKMYIGLNTSAKPLKDGELLKAFGYRGKCIDIELAKALVGHTWTSNLNRLVEESREAEVMQRVKDTRDLWVRVHGEIGESARCASLKCMVVLIISSKSGELAHLDSTWPKKLEHHLSPEGVSIDVLSILDHIDSMLNVLDEIKGAGGSLMHCWGPKKKCSMPATKVIKPLWNSIINRVVPQDAVCAEKLVWFYVEITKTEYLLNQYKSFFEKDGDGHVSKDDLRLVDEFIARAYASRRPRRRLRVVQPHSEQSSE